MYGKSQVLGLHQLSARVHLDLHRYWLAKCKGRVMPARGDIEPAEIPALLPYISIFHETDGQFRYRLAGTAVVQQIGRDPTGDIVGGHVRSPRETVAAVQALARRVFTAAQPVFSAGQCENVSGYIYNVSALILPLSDSGTSVDMALFSRIAHFNIDAVANTAWQQGAPLHYGDIQEVSSTADLQKYCVDWERSCAAAAVRLTG
jgi:hypothetical protein